MSEEAQESGLAGSVVGKLARCRQYAQGVHDVLQSEKVPSGDVPACDGQISTREAMTWHLLRAASRTDGVSGGEGDLHRCGSLACCRLCV